MGELVGDVYINVVLAALLEMPFIIVAMFTINRLGRKKPYMFCFGLMAVSSLGSILLELNKRKLSYIMV